MKIAFRIIERKDAEGNLSYIIKYKKRPWHLCWDTDAMYYGFNKTFDNVYPTIKSARERCEVIAKDIKSKWITSKRIFMEMEI